MTWLEKEGVRSAVTTAPGLAAPRSNRLLLPRYLDADGITDKEFVAWLSGFAGFARTLVGSRH